MVHPMNASTSFDSTEPYASISCDFSRYLDGQSVGRIVELDKLDYLADNVDQDVDERREAPKESRRGDKARDNCSRCCYRRAINYC